MPPASSTSPAPRSTLDVESAISAPIVELVGDTPIGHLTFYRMYLASVALRDPRRRLIEIAESVGYASEKAFIRAFRRWSAMAPKQYARNQRDPYDMARGETERAA
ncbi:helix-turn-helix domain-containing protein [Paraburkholderia sp. Cpub6]|uniref:helix-turn-helix domain-containing protein n=1 Tax=Paraburkholderia sp. Cpub6 TaxID=2723094 RepID=UPI00161CFC9B|nr:helix-turn-helix domain-containing protein [Paraburkholderia sp. Cpub6]MBB5456501.1 AraC-like DNA-binding protein [Paraburkholderia sp. Cpub6]